MSDSQGAGELIEDGETGLLTPVDEVHPLALAIKSLLEDRSFADRLAINSSQLYWEKYSQQVIVSQYEEVYQNILIG